LSEANQIRQYIESKGYAFVTAIHVNTSTKTALLEVLRERLQGRAGAGFTSRRQLHFIAKAIGDRFDLRVLFAFRDSARTSDIEAGLRANLMRAFQDVVLGAFVSFESVDTAVVWVEVIRAPEPSRRAHMQEVAERYLGEFDIKVASFELLTPALPEASLPAILRTIKRMAPVGISVILADLSSRGFSRPTEKWLSAKLDAARKRHLVQRDSRGQFVLTAAGLAAVPNTRTKSSSDIDRILWLARRKEW
jgi:hypothetical protein